MMQAVTSVVNRPPAVRRPSPPEPIRVAPSALLFVIGAGAFAVIVLWWLDTPSVHGFGAWLTNAGRVLGLLAGYGVVVLVGLMARLPPVENGLGADRLARWHAMGGRYVVSVIWAHALLIIWGYAVTDHTNVVSQAATLVLDYPDVLMATVAAFLLLAVGLVSARAARRRMRYETWYYLHLYTYLAIALAFSHQFATGAEFISDAKARALWIVIYSVIGASVLWYRVVTPLLRFRRHHLHVVDVRAEAPGVVSIVVKGRNLHLLNVRPGQFFRWRFLERGLWWASNPYSLSAPVRGDFMRITVKDLGDHSRSLSRLRPGTRVLAEGPYGAFAGRISRHRRPILLIAGGVGITPLRALFEALPARPGQITLVYRTSSPADIIFRRELDAIAAGRRATVHYLVGPRGRAVMARLPELVPGLRHAEVYVCGPPGMADYTIGELAAAGVPRARIHHEAFEF
jgi:predicted ferric reductase